MLGVDGKESNAKSIEQWKAVAEVLLNLANGDWRQPGFQHFCWRPGCCAGPDGQRSVHVCVDKLCAWMLEFLFQDLGTQRHSTIRGFTFPITLALRSLGFLLHRVVPRVFSAALDVDGDEGNCNADAEGGDEVSAWRVFVCLQKLPGRVQQLPDAHVHLLAKVAGAHAKLPRNYCK